MATGINPGFAGIATAPGQVNLISGFNMNTTGSGNNAVTTSNAFVIGTPSPGGRRGTVALANNLTAPGGSTFIQALGVNKNGLVVGTYTDLNGIMTGSLFRCRAEFSRRSTIPTLISRRGSAPGSTASIPWVRSSDFIPTA
jgi:hypothetical protein